MKAFTNHSQTATAMAIAALLTACGGGETDPGTQTQSRNEAPQAQENPEKQAMLELAKRENIGRTAFALTASAGKYGTVLREAGWSLDQVSTLTQIPNDGKTVVYINASDPLANAKALVNFMAGFKGVVVVDSDWTHVPEPSADAEPGGAPADAGANPLPAASSFYAAITSGKLPIPTATAVVHSASEQTIMPVNINEDGLVNGFTAQAFNDAMDMRVMAAVNLDKSRSLQAKDLGTPNYTIDIFETKDGWIGAGRYNVWRYKTNDGKYYVALEMRTGDNTYACKIKSTYNCGVYPTGPASVIWTDLPNINDGTRRRFVSYAKAYSAYFDIQATSSEVLEYRPSAEAWTATETVDSNSYEKVWSEGFSLGGAFGVNSMNVWSIGASAGYSRASLHRKRFDTWKGASGNGSNYFWSGVNLINNVAPTAWNDKSCNTCVDEKPARERLLQSAYDMGGNYNKKNIKPKMAFEGWQPSVSGVFRVVPKTYVGIPYAIVTGRLKWHRAQQYQKQRYDYWINSNNFAVYVKNSKAWVNEDWAKNNTVVNGWMSPGSATYEATAAVTVQW